MSLDNCDTEFLPGFKDPDYELRLVVLIENTSCVEHITPEHGLSIYIEFNGECGLYDVGQTSNIIGNALESDILLDELDWIALSHGHYDHTGGLMDVLKTSPKNIPVYTGIDAFKPKFARRPGGNIDSIGCPFTKEEIEEVAETVTESAGMTEITKNVFLIGPSPMKESYEAPSKYMLIQNDDGEYINDVLEDERTLAIKTSEGIVIITGCAHRGSVNITKHVMSLFPNDKVLLVIGGFHLGKTGDEAVMKRINALNELNLGGIGLCHCTGAKASKLFREKLPDTCFIAPAGSEILL